MSPGRRGHLPTNAPVRDRAPGASRDLARAPAFERIDRAGARAVGVGQGPRDRTPQRRERLARLPRHPPAARVRLAAAPPAPPPPAHPHRRDTFGRPTPSVQSPPPSTTGKGREMPRIERFSGKYHFLSNFHPHPIRGARGLVYPTAEAAFQGGKTTTPTERAWIAAAPTPSVAKRRGRLVTLRDDWD